MWGGSKKGREMLENSHTGTSNCCSIWENDDLKWKEIHRKNPTVVARSTFLTFLSTYNIKCSSYNNNWSESELRTEAKNLSTTFYFKQFISFLFRGEPTKIFPFILMCCHLLLHHVVNIVFILWFIKIITFAHISHII